MGESLLLSALIVVALVTAAPLLNALITGKFYEEVYGKPLRIKRLFHNPSRGVAPWILDGIEDEE